ncbi:unnamed protein product [Lactuca saligna]|uniref:Uncharacterized protein n=1 Tax=Lactuca saligna TaxID=75948 RepID=A0AA35UT61_LACSI|nr:unnamed protein product [Lactuca saligna]
MLRKLYDEEDLEEERIEKDEEEDFGPIYDTDGEEEFCERINFLVEEEFIDEIEEETNFVIGDEFVEAIVEEINFVDMDKIVEEIVIFVEQQISFQELTTTRTNDYKCHKNSGSHIFYEHNFFSKDLKEIQIGSFIDQEGLFVFHLHFRFKVWEIFTLWRPWNAYILHFEGLGERFDFTNYDLNNDFFVLSSLIDQKEKTDLCITFDKKFCAIRDGDFSFVAQKQQDQLFLDDGRILYPSKDIMMISKKICVHGGINQSPKEALRGNSYAYFLCCPQTKHIFINSSFIVQKHQDRWREVCWERKKKDGIHTFTNHLSKRKYEDASPNYLHRRELMMFGLIFFRCAFNWEAVILGHAAHQLTNTNHDPFFKMTTINHLNYCEVIAGSSSWECTKVVFHPQIEDTFRIEFGELFEEEHVYVEKRPSWSKENVTLCNKNLFSRLAVREGSYGGTKQFGSY